MVNRPQNKRKYLCIVYLTRGLYPIYIRHSNDSTTNNVKFNNLSRN